MKRYVTLILVSLLTTLTLTAQLPTGDPVAAGFSPERLERLDNYFQSLINQGTLPNAQTLILRHGKVIHRGTYGYSDLENRTPARPDDIYRIASQTKALVTVGLMMEYERGKLLLEDPVSKYLPVFADMQVLKDHDPETGAYTTEPANRQITIRDLLTHTSGIPYGLPIDESHPELNVPLFGSLDNVTTTEVVDRIAARPLLHHPGEQFTYGLGIDVAGRVLEAISGQDLDDYLHDNIWKPLGMSDSHFYLPRNKYERLVKLYSKAQPDDPLTLHENVTYQKFPTSGAQSYFSGGAGSVGTIDDYARFCQLMLNRGELNGVRLLAPKTVDFMTRNQIGDLKVWDRQDGFGIGFQVGSEDSRYLDMATPGSYTWGGMYLSEYTIDPTEELVMLFYTNVHPISQYSEICRKFRILVYQALVDE